jgi:sterol 3beta-glucosyltransferase
VKHRDWYVDEGASNPVFGAVASVSGTLTNTIVTVNKYTKDLSHTVHKKAGDKSPISSMPELEEPEPQEWSLRMMASRNPVSRAAAYPPHHLEMVAYHMASKTLPHTKSGSKYQKAYSWSPVHHSSTTKSTASKATKHEHGKLHEAGSETGHLTVSLLGTGLKGMLL